jgi:transposase
MMKSLNGNESDKTSFKNSIETHVRNLPMELGTEYLIGDSALYTAEGLKLMTDVLWISRVPETLADAKWVIEATAKDLMCDLDKEACVSVCMSYADVQQRWVVYYSPEAYKRSVASVNRQILKSSESEQKAFEKLTQQEFACEQDAQEASKKLIKALKIVNINDLEIVKKGRFNKKGRPAKNAVPDYYGWKIEGGVSTNIENRAAKIRRKSCFILATNQLDDQQLNEEEILHKYKKDQQKVERGFRFLKDPQFLASTLYLKKPERIMALLMIMTLSLLIYATLEHKIRKALRENDETFPNQLGKPIKKPTARWVFQCFSGIHVLIINKVHKLIMNLKEIHYKLLRLLGKKFERIYSEYRVLV